MDIVTSRANPRVREILSLKKRAARDKFGLAFIEGPKVVGEALGAVTIKTVCVSESFAQSGAFREIVLGAERHGVKLLYVTDALYAAMSDTMSPQGALAVIPYFDYSAGEVLFGGRKPGEHGRRRRLLILDRVSDPGNVGVMIRTAEAAAFSGVVLSEECADIYAPKTLRATMGSFLRIPFLRGANLPGLLEELRLSGFSVYATGVLEDGAQNCFAADIGGGDIAIVIGSEAGGVDKRLAAQCDGVLYIPMPGGAESLNAGVAAGIIMYEIIRRDQGGLRPGGEK